MRAEPSDEGNTFDGSLGTFTKAGRFDVFCDVPGAESAGADPGPVSYDMGNEVPTVMDCMLIMGILNPDNYLGGKLKLNKEKALEAIKEQCADVLGVGRHDRLVPSGDPPRPDSWTGSPARC